MENILTPDIRKKVDSFPLSHVHFNNYNQELDFIGKITGK